MGMPDENAGEFVGWSIGVLLEVVEDEKIIFEGRGLAVEFGHTVGESFEVFFALASEGFAGFFHLDTVVEVLDGLFEADGDEQAENDSCDVDEEIAPSGGGVVGGVNVEHRGGLLGGGRCLRHGFGGLWRGDYWIGRDGSGVGHCAGWR